MRYSPYSTQSLCGLGRPIRKGSMRRIRGVGLVQTLAVVAMVMALACVEPGPAATPTLFPDPPTHTHADAGGHPRPPSRRGHSYPTPVSLPLDNTHVHPRTIASSDGRARPPGRCRGRSNRNPVSFADEDTHPVSHLDTDPDACSQPDAYTPRGCHHRRCLSVRLRPSPT